MWQLIAETGATQMDESGDEATAHLPAQPALATASGRPCMQHASPFLQAVTFIDAGEQLMYPAGLRRSSRVCLWDVGQIISEYTWVNLLWQQRKKLSDCTAQGLEQPQQSSIHVVLRGNMPQQRLCCWMCTAANAQATVVLCGVEEQHLLQSCDNSYLDRLQPFDGRDLL